MLFFQIFDGLILVLIVIGALPVVGFLFFQVFSFVLALILWIFFIWVHVIICFVIRSCDFWLIEVVIMWATY